MALLGLFLDEAGATLSDLVPIAVLLAIFQFAILRRPIPRLGRILVGLAYVALGLTLFRIGIAQSFVPIGRDMARQLIEPALAAETSWWRYAPLYAFAGLLGFTAALIEPTLTAAADRVRVLSGGSFRPWALRLAVASGFGVGLLIGTMRVVHGVPMAYLVAGLVAITAALALTAPRAVVPLAFDSGAIATSAVTVPLIAAYGVSIAETMPGRSALADGFGLIVLALLCPAIALLGLAQVRFRSRATSNPGENDAV
jgi:Protein of unknown function (DUF1538)